MNRAYKSIYNEKTGTFVAVAENVKAKGKRSSSRVSKAGALAAVVATGALFMGSAGAQVDVGENYTSAGTTGTISNVSNLMFTSGGSISGLSSLQVDDGLSADTIYAATSLSVSDNTTINSAGITTNNVNVGTTGSVVAGSTTVNNTGLTVGATTVSNAGVTVGSSTLNGTGLVISGSGGPSVTTAGIDAGGQTITNVGAGTADSDAVNVGQLNAVSTTASAGWDISADAGTAANVGSGGSVDFSGDGNIEVSLSGTNLGFSLADDITVNSVTAGGVVLNSSGVTIAGGPSITAAGIEVGGMKITGLAEGDLEADSTDAVSGKQIFDLFIEEGAGGVRYFRARSAQPDSQALGDESIAIGPRTVAEGDSSLAAGDGAITTKTGEGAIALGQDATAGGELIGGEAAIAIGRESEATGDSAVALGDDASASGINATALGAGAAAGGDGGVALGQDAVAAATNNISVGNAAGQNTSQVVPGDQSHNIAVGNASGQDVAGQFNVAMGDHAGNRVDGDYNIALGHSAGGNQQGEANVSIGRNAKNSDANEASVNQAVSIGEDAHTTGSRGVSIGHMASAGREGVALGSSARTTGTGVAIGRGAIADNSGYIALGSGSRAAQSDIMDEDDPSQIAKAYLTDSIEVSGVVSVGNRSSGQVRRITNVADGAHDNDAVNVQQLYAAVNGIDLSDPNFSNGIIQELRTDINENMMHYVSINDDGDMKDNRGNDGALGTDSIAIGPEAKTEATAVNSTAIGYMTTASGGSAVVLGHNITGEGANSTTIGNSESKAYGESGIAIGTFVESRDQNSIVIGRDSYTNRQADGPAVDNSIVIGTQSSSTAVEGIVIGKDSVVNAARGIAQGSAAHATAGDAMAFGTRSSASGARAQASGTDASAHGTDSIASGTGAIGWANDGIAMGSGAVSGFEDPANLEPRRNMSGIAIGDSALADNYHALALGVDARATDESATAIGDDAEASAEDALAVGSGAKAAALNASAFGQGANALGDNSSAIGSDATAFGQNASAFGQGAQATGMGTLAVGSRAEASALNASAFGQGAQATHENAVALGAGSMTGIANPTSQGTVNDIIYGEFAGTNPTSVVSVGVEGAERQITNVAAGRIEADSTDAINGSQLFATQTVIGNVAHSTASALGGDASVGGDGTITMSNVGGTEFHTVHEAIEYAAQGWDVSVNDDGTSDNVAPGGSVDFSNTDDNIVIARDGTDLVFNLASELDIGTSITVGDTVINRDSVTTTNLTVGGNTTLGAHFTVNDNGVYYDGPITEGDHITNKTYVDGAVEGLADTPLTFAGDYGGDVDRLLGETVSLVGGATDEDALTEGNIGVVADGTDTLEIKLNKDIDLGDDGSVAIGDTLVNNDGLIVGDTIIHNEGLITSDGAGNVTMVEAGVVSVVGGDTDGTTIIIDGNAGTIGGLNNQTIDYPEFADGSGRAATEEQLGEVSEVANRGWNISANGDDDSANVAPGSLVDFSNTDENIVLALEDITDDDGNVVGQQIGVNLANELDIGTSITVGDTVINRDSVTTTNLTVGGNTTLGAHFTVNDNGVYYDGPITEGDHITNKTYVDGAVEGLADTPLTFAGDYGDNVERQLGQTVSLVGGATDEDALTEGNIGVVADGTDTLEIKLNKDIDLGDDGSVAIGDTLVNNDGLIVGDTVIHNEGLIISDGDGNVTMVEAGVVSVVGGDTDGTTIIIDGNAGTIGGLNNQTVDYPEFADGSGRAATEEQLGEVSEVANRGWNISANGDDDSANVAPGSLVDFSNTDENIVLALEDITDDDGDVIGQQIGVNLASTLEIGGDATNPGVLIGDEGAVDGDGNAIPGITVPGGTNGDQNVVIGGGDITLQSPNWLDRDGNPVGPIQVGETLMSGLNFSGNNYDGSDGTVINKRFGETLEILGEGWIETEVRADGKMYIQLADNFPVVPKPEEPGSGGGGTDPVNPGDGVGNIIAGGDLIGGDNINIRPGDDDHSLIIETNPDVEHDSVTVGEVVINEDGINAGGNQITNVAAGTERNHATNVGQLEDGLNQLDDDLTQKGLNFADSAGNVAHRDLGETLHIVGANENITTSVTQGSILEIALSNDLQVDSVTINNGGPIINQNGIDMSDNRITNVADGVAPGDAVNVGQLDRATDNLQGQVNNLRGDLRRQDRKLSAGVAAAMATAALPQAYLPGKTMMSMAAGTWNGESGMAMGFSGITDNGHWVYKLSGNATSRGDYGGAIGVGYQW